MLYFMLSTSSSLPTSYFSLYVLNQDAPASLITQRRNFFQSIPQYDTSIRKAYSFRSTDYLWWFQLWQRTRLRW
jgi:hypothetical protein